MRWTRELLAFVLIVHCGSLFADESTSFGGFDCRGDQPTCTAPTDPCGPCAEETLCRRAQDEPFPSETNSHHRNAQQEGVLKDFLTRFNRIASTGFVKTRRAGSTGVGYTLESLLDLKENNLPGRDFCGMEVKAFRDNDVMPDEREKMNLFLKEPDWLDGLTAVHRVREYGYRDAEGRTAWYLSVTCVPNSA